MTGCNWPISCQISVAHFHEPWTNNREMERSTVFRVKICGITNVADAEVAAAAGADAIGLNFFPDSPRCVDPQTAERIVAAVGQQMSVVGVFVNAPINHMLDLADRLSLDFIQLHGDEPSSQLLDLAHRNIIRAFRLRPGDEKVIQEFVAASQDQGSPLAALLVDAYQKGSFGGTGKIANWGGFKAVSQIVHDCPILLAGGLHPDNVRDAIHQTHCHGVDVASGVEVEPGQKDVTKTRRFIRSALDAFQEIA